MNIIVSKEIRINVRTTEEIKREIEITARLRGLTVSSLINYLAVQAIREEKEREPQAFKDSRRGDKIWHTFTDGIIHADDAAERLIENKNKKETSGRKAA